MATVTHIIHSLYDPPKREKLEREIGQRADNQSDPWQTESSFSAQRRIPAAPSFVPATISRDEWGAPRHTSAFTSSLTRAAEDPASQPCSSAAEWYRSLTMTSREVHPLRPSSAAPSPSTSDARLPQTQLTSRRGETITKDNWFIHNVLHSEPSTKPSSPVPIPSLADLLARDPPPLPSEGRFVPPVWLHIGPSNRGFGMLQRNGWNEGEGLGAHAPRPAARTRDGDWHVPSSRMMWTAGQNTADVIDLTQLDSKVSKDALKDDAIDGSVQTQATSGEPSTPHIQKSLLTPLPVVLKADRLGIGLKAKTHGSYKRSEKHVTHNATALAAHMRSAEEMRRTKAAVGKGKRGFVKIYKREEEKRRTMLSYLNE